MKSVVFTFGRMNPPTTGHQLLVNKLVSYARQHGAAPRVYLSHSVGAKDPLQYDKKVAFARAAFGSLVKKSNARTVIEVLKQLHKEGYTHVTMFAGSDRVPEFTKLLQKYNGKEYNFESIEVKSAGERDPDADDVSGMSASKMRALAKDDKVVEFLRGAPNTLKAAQAKNMFTAVRKALLGEDVMDFTHDERFVHFVIESSDEDAIELPSEGEIDKMIDSIDVKDLDLDDADAMMLDLLVGKEEDEEDKEEVKEAKILSAQARQKLAQRMKAMSKRLAKLRQIKSKQMPAAQRLRLRARKAALMALRRRATGKKNLDYNSLSRSQRIAVDTALVQRFGGKLSKAIDVLSKRILPKIRSKAQQNVAKAREIKEAIDVVYPGTTKQVPDQKKDNPLNVDPTKLTINTIDPTKDDRTAPDPQTAHQNRNKRLRFRNVFNGEEAVVEGRKSSADKDARDAGDTNIIYQMRKTVNSRGEHETTFADGHKAHISIADAKKLLAKFDALRLPADKHEFTIQAGKSLASFKDVMAHGVKHEKKKISLGGRKFNEFYLGVGRSRTVSAYDNDEPPGTRRVAEAAKDEDRPEDPNRSRPLSQKMDLLLRLGLVDQEELQNFRRALRSSKKFALQSPVLRQKLADLLDKLIDLTTKDPATYSRVRYNVVQKEAYALLNKAEKSGVDVDIIFEVFARGYEKNEDINEAFSRVNSFIAGGKAADMDKDLSEKVKSPTGGLKGACWKNYTAVGFKMKNGRRVPNCVPKEETQIDEISQEKKDKYIQRSASSHSHWNAVRRDAQSTGNKSAEDMAARKMKNRNKGMSRAFGEDTQVDEVLDTTVSRMNYLQKAGKQMYGKGSADAKSQTFKKRLAGAKMFNRMTDRKPKVPYDVKKEEVETEGYVVKYHDEKGKYKNTSRVFTTKDKADAHAERGNRITRVGGKYSVHQVNDKGHEVKEAFEIKDKEAETSYNTHDDMMKNVDRAKLKTVVAGLLKDMSDRERKVIHARFWENKPLAKVAKEMNVSPERIRQIEARVLRKLKSPINAKKLSAFREETQIDEVSSALLYRAKQAAQKKAGWLMPGDKGKGDKAWNRVKKFRDAGVEKEKQERAAKKVNESFAEQMSTHEPIPLQKRVKRVKSFHVGHSKPMGEAQRVADVKLVKTKLPDGRIVYRKERTTTNVQHEMYTGSEPVSGNRADPANRFVGTNAIRQNYASVTPGQGSVAGEIAVAKFAPEKVDYSSSLIKKTRTEVDQSKENLGQKHLKDIQKALSGIREQTELNESFSAGFELAPFARDYGIQVQSSFTHHPEVQEALDAQEDAMNEAIYQGRDVPLNKPMKGDVKKSKVYVRDPSTGNIKKVNFGDKKLSIKKDQPGRKRSYCARSSGQGNLTKKTSANYWSRRAWDC